MPSILFICTGNEYRSPIAAAYFRKILQRHNNDQGWVVGSAGTWTTSNRPIGRDVIRHAILLGLDLHYHQTQVVTESLLRIYDLILCMERGHKEAICIEFPHVSKHVYLLSEMVHEVPFDVPDPHASPENVLNILIEMCDLIQNGYPKITQLAEELAIKRT